MQFTRRQLLKRSLGATAACGLARWSFADAAASSGPIVDTHVYLGHWPFKLLPDARPTDLVATLRRNNVVQAWIGSFDGLFHKDIGGVNQRLADLCARDGRDMLLPFGTVNPTLPDWEDDVRRCHETFRMPGVRLHPNYHGYTLDDPRFARLLELAAARGLIVQLVAWMEDERHVLLSPHTAQVELKPLAEQVTPHRDLRLVVANGFRAAEAELFRTLLPKQRLYFDVGRAAHWTVVRWLVEKASPDRVVFGSCAPLHSVESAATTLHQAQLSVADWQAVATKTSSDLMATKNTRNRKTVRVIQPQ